MFRQQFSTNFLITITAVTLYGGVNHERDVEGPHGQHPVEFRERVMALHEFPREELHGLVQNDDWEGYLQHNKPLAHRQRTDREDGREYVHIQNDEMQCHRQGYGRYQKQVCPGRHLQKRLVLRQTVEGIEHFDGDKDGEGHCHRVRIRENGAVHTLKLGGILLAGKMVGQLVVIEAWSVRRSHEPPAGCTDSRSSHITSNGHVAKEEPSRN